MTLIKTSLLSAIATIIRTITGFFIVKLISVVTGPTGLALVAQVQNFIGMMSSLASGGIESGVVKYTAEFKDNENEKKKIWSNALKLSLILTLIVAIFVAIFSKYISKKLLSSEEYYFVFILFSITIIFFVLNGILISILNGQGEIKKLTILNIIGSIVSLFISIFLVINFNIKGALVTGIFSQSIVFFITLFFILKSNWFKINVFIDSLDKKTIINLLKFSAMTLTAVIANMSALIFLRNYIGTKLGWNAAGYWQGVWKISETYLMLITTTLSIYYLPKLSSIHDKEELKKEILYGYKIIMPIVIILALSIYIFRDLIIKIVFTEDFAPMSQLFLFQLIGDVIKMASWLLGYIMVAKAMAKMFIFTEVLFVTSFVLISIAFIKINGLIGITQAFMLNYILYFIALVVIFYKK